MARIQHGSYNVAGDGDRVAVQVGEIRPASDRQPAPQVESGGSENIRTGNATVDRQEDVIVGDLRI